MSTWLTSITVARSTTRCRLSWVPIRRERPMTLTHGGDPTTEADNLVGITIDGHELRVPKGTLLIRAAEQVGITIPRFCDHPLLDPVGACRQCLVEVEGQRKPPLASCTTTATDGMIVRTQLSSEIAADAQRGVMELLLINHPPRLPGVRQGRGGVPAAEPGHVGRS